MAYSREIETSIDAIIASWPNVEKKRMFGGVCYLMNGNICFGIINDFLIVRAGEETARKRLRERHVRPFDITGKPMKGWLMVERTGWQTAEDLHSWLSVGKDFAATLPAK